ncbi:MAG TPA: glycosyltransferase family 39 protein [Acidobacteriaceae bacterium]|nr:glycosyltransferase family 39 protein [Acidobacteriaceae bacterium]
MAQTTDPRSERRSLLPILLVAAGVLLLHLLTNTRYGFHRDELQFLSDALHLDWGYVAYPPLTPFIERISMALFGLSMEGLRLFSVLAQVVVVITAGLIARTLGGNRLAQGLAALAVALSPIALFEGTEFQYTTFEQFAWVLATYGVVRLLSSEDERWWIWIGAFSGIGLMAKYTVVFFVIALLAGFLVTPARRLMASRWFVLGCALTVLIVLPNLVWQVRHDFISLHFLEHIHARDLRIGRGKASDFWIFQAILSENAFAIPLTIAGVVAAWRSVRYRAVSIAFVLTIVLFAGMKARGYYTAAIFPVVIAFGAAAFVQWASRRRPVWRRSIFAVLFAGILGLGVYFACVLVPIASGGALKTFALAHSEDLREQLGWDTFVQTVANVRDTLAPEQRASFGIVTANYGEQGAVELLGRSYGLPAPISTTNSAWLRGYPTPQPGTLIVTGLDFDDANGIFTGCRLAAHIGYPANLNNEESKYHPDIFVCGPPRLPWPEFWKKYQRFG